MAAKGHRFPLLIYRHTISTIWPAIITIGVIMIGMVAVSWLAEFYINPLDNPIPNIPTTQGAIILGVGIFTVAFAIFLLFLPSMAYVQPYDSYLRISTPFMRFNISYKRVVRTYTAAMYTLLPAKLSRWRREMISPMAAKTAVVVELRGFPVSPGLLYRFLSPYFFKDKTPHIILLVHDWMRFSMELESLRSGGALASGPSGPRKKSGGILSNLNSSRK